VTVARAWSILASPRWRKRALTVASHSANSLVTPLLGPLVSAGVVRLAGVDLWGELVRVLVMAQLVSHVAVWGNKDYLLREFSRDPAGRTAAWQTGAVTRLALWAAGVAVLALVGFGATRLALAGLLALALVTAQAFEVFVAYRRDFVFAFGVEVITVGGLAGAVLVAGPGLTVEVLLALFAAGSFGKAGLLLWRYRAEVGPRWAGKFAPAWLRAALPFFVLGFSGLLQSRVDLYAVSAYLPPAEVGRYQVYTSLILYLQAGSALVLVPFLKGYYRLGRERLLGASAWLSGLGLLVAATGIPAVVVGLRLVYGLTFAPGYFLAGALYVLPIYFYLPIIYALFQANRPGQVVAVNALGIGVNAALMLWWLPAFGSQGAAWASAAAEWSMVMLYVFLSRRLTHAVPVPALS
jgi:O-antigen/teichoic acid export membrane protein